MYLAEWKQRNSYLKFVSFPGLIVPCGMETLISAYPIKLFLRINCTLRNGNLKSKMLSLNRMVGLIVPCGMETWMPYLGQSCLMWINCTLRNGNIKEEDLKGRDEWINCTLRNGNGYNQNRACTAS